MPRRGENIRKRKDGRWEARYPCGVNEKGATRYRSVYGTSYREVKEKRNRLLQQERPPDTADSRLFRNVLQQWIEDHQLRLKASSVYRYRYLIEKHILPALGNTPMERLTPGVINRFLGEKLTHGRADGSGLSPAYVRSIMLVIRSAISHASADRSSPALAQICKPAERIRELPVLSRQDQEKLERALLTAGDATALGVYISLYTGLRIGEICALSWEDVDLEERTIHVRHTVVRVRCEENGVVSTRNAVDLPKTQASFRCVPICSKLLPVLTEAKSSGACGYIVSSGPEFLSPRTFSYRYGRLLRTAGVPYIHYHGLRHTFATRCIEAGVDVKSLSEILGHSNVSVTLNTYVHSSMEMKRTQLEKLTGVPG